MENLENEIWKRVKDSDEYYVSNKGRVKRGIFERFHNINKSFYTTKDRIKKLSNSNSKKYWRVGICYNKKTILKSVHRLVAEAFINNLNNSPQVNHIDGNKNNNNVENLEWCTNLENMRHSIALGLRNWNHATGEKSVFNKFSPKLLLQIPELILKGLTHKQIGKELGISSTLISEIKAGRTWKSLNIIIPDKPKKVKML